MHDVDIPCMYSSSIPQKMGPSALCKHSPYALIGKVAGVVCQGESLGIPLVSLATTPTQECNYNATNGDLFTVLAHWNGNSHKQVYSTMLRAYSSSQGPSSSFCVRTRTHTHTHTHTNNISTFKINEYNYIHVW